jgi:RNA polymerase sigma-70 factor (ECF subfamily)
LRVKRLDKTKVINAENRFIVAQEQRAEQELINKAKHGDQQAFHQLYLTHHRRVYGICWRMLADKDSAEDVCQEVFVQLWQKISNFRGESKFSTWLHSVTSNVVLGHLRKQKNWLQRMFSIEEQVIQDVAVEMEDTSGLTALDQHIARLPERARLVFVLFAVEGYRHEEIANMLGMAVGSSKAQFHRAKQLLREWVEI